MTRIEKRRSIDMTSGPLFGKIVLFIIPLIATNLLQMLYNAADIRVVGLSSNPDAVGAVGSTSAFLNLVVNIFIGVSTGADVVVARYIGARDGENTSRAVHTSVCMGLIFGAAGGIVGVSLASPVLTMMGYEGNLLTLGIRYCWIYFACLPFLALTNFLCAILRAKGDTRTPLLVLAGAGLLNVALNLFFVLVLGLSVEGVALATAIANAVSAFLLWRHLSRDAGDCRLSFRLLRPSRKQFGEISRIGFPAGLQNAMFSISNMLIQSSILQVNNTLTPPNAAYAPVIKGDSATNSIESFMFSALNATTVAASAFTGQNVGVRDYRRVRRVLFLVAASAVGIAAVMSGTILIFHDRLLSLYGVVNADDTLSQLAYNTAMSRVWWKWPTFVIFAMMNSAAGVLRGLGKSLTSATISLVGTCVFRVVWIYTVFAALERVEAIYVSYPISWFLTGAVFWITVLLILRRKMRVS